MEILKDIIFPIGIGFGFILVLMLAVGLIGMIIGSIVAWLENIAPDIYNSPIPKVKPGKPINPSLYNQILGSGKPVCPVCNGISRSIETGIESTGATTGGPPKETTYFSNCRCCNGRGWLHYDEYQKYTAVRKEMIEKNLELEEEKRKNRQIVLNRKKNDLKLCSACDGAGYSYYTDTGGARFFLQKSVCCICNGNGTLTKMK